MTWWTILTFSLCALLIVGGFAYYERSRPSARTIAVIATLAALAAVARIAFAPLPSVKPTTDLVFFAGFTLGGPPGFAVGAIAALTSNFFFGQGPWTPLQMLAWGAIGLVGAGFGRMLSGQVRRFVLAAVCAFAGLFYGVIVNVGQWLMLSGDQGSASLIAYCSSSLLFDLAHAIGNAVLCVIFGPALVRALRRFRSRTKIRWLDGQTTSARLPQPSSPLPRKASGLKPS